MKYSVSIIFTFFISTLFGTTIADISDSSNSQKSEMTFLTWSEYMDPEIVTEFENEFNAKINFVYYEGNDERDRMVTDTNGQGYDLVVLNDPVVKAYYLKGWLEPLSKKEIPNLKHIITRWETPVEGAKTYTSPYFWGTTGIAYRKDLVPEEITSWKQYFSPDEKLKGKISMMEDVMDVTSMAMKALGYSANNSDPNAHNELKTLLYGQQPFVKVYEYISLGKESALVSGDVWVTMAYNGDALMVAEHNENIAYVVPEEGGNLWVDYFVIMKSGKNKPLAKKFLNFLNRPKIAARNAAFVYYATPNKAAEKFLSQDHLTDEIIYPPQEILNKSEFYADLPPRIIKKRNSIFSHVMRK